MFYLRFCLIHAYGFSMAAQAVVFAKANCAAGAKIASGAQQAE